MLTVSVAGQQDIEPWLNLAREVEYLFGPLIDSGFDRAITSNIERQSAFCIRNPNDPTILSGGLLFDYRDSSNYELTWLAVHTPSRRTGVGRDLVLHALEQTVKPSIVKVVTFGPDHEGGHDARRFYATLGFSPGKKLPDGPEGGSRQEYILKQEVA